MSRLGLHGWPQIMWSNWPKWVGIWDFLNITYSTLCLAFVFRIWFENQIHLYTSMFAIYACLYFDVYYWYWHSVSNTSWCLLLYWLYAPCGSLVRLIIWSIANLLNVVIAKDNHAQYTERFQTMCFIRDKGSKHSDEGHSLKTLSR